MDTIEETAPETKDESMPWSGIDTSGWTDEQRAELEAERALVAASVERTGEISKALQSPDVQLRKVRAERLLTEAAERATRSMAALGEKSMSEEAARAKNYIAGEEAYQRLLASYPASNLIRLETKTHLVVTRTWTISERHGYIKATSEKSASEVEMMAPELMKGLILYPDIETVNSMSKLFPLFWVELVDAVGARSWSLLGERIKKGRPQ